VSDTDEATAPLPHHVPVRRHRARAIAIAAAVALFGFGPTAEPVRAAVTARLPDLATLAPFDFRIEQPTSGTRLLRFSTVVVNVGAGPFQLYGYDEDGAAKRTDSLLVRQQILQSDGTFVDRNTTATMAWGTDGHDHFHALGLQRIELQAAQGSSLLRSAKTGFCFLDSYEFRSKEASHYNRDNFVCQVAPTRSVPMGISVGWGDIYKATFAFQWIDVTGLPAGDYVISLVVDPPGRLDRHRRSRGFEPGGRFLESDESNNRGWTKIHLTKRSVTVLSRSAKP
jgi:hypothetical protein